MKLIILDRDGVINQSGADMICSAEQWQAINGSIEAIAQLHKAGFTLVIATNQPGLAEGKLDLDELEAIHAKLSDLVENAGGAISAIFYCPHGPEDRCNCRKPKAGLIDAIEAEFDISAQGVPVIGDRIQDIDAALSKGCDPILVKTGLGVETLNAIAANPENSAYQNIPVFENLSAAALHIIEKY
jgi:D-glycero-D-manno-heptose 1,7-bisphosphate phosphatase